MVIEVREYVFQYSTPFLKVVGQLLNAQLLTQTLAHQANEKVDTCSPVNFNEKKIHAEIECPNNC